MAPRGSITVAVGPATIVVTGLGHFQYGQKYLRAALELNRVQPADFDPVLLQLYCQSLELFLKSYIWLADRKTNAQIKRKYGHDLEKLWSHCKTRGIRRYVAETPLRDRIVGLVGPFYKDRRFAYFDLDMLVGAYDPIRSEPRTVFTLHRLATRLEASLQRPVLVAS